MTGWGEGRKGWGDEGWRGRVISSEKCPLFPWLRLWLVTNGTETEIFVDFCCFFLVATEKFRIFCWKFFGFPFGDAWKQKSDQSGQRNHKTSDVKGKSIVAGRVVQKSWKKKFLCWKIENFELKKFCKKMNYI